MARPRRQCCRRVSPGMRERASQPSIDRSIQTTTVRPTEEKERERVCGRWSFQGPILRAPTQSLTKQACCEQSIVRGIGSRAATNQPTSEPTLTQSGRGIVYWSYGHDPEDGAELPCCVASCGVFWARWGPLRSRLVRGPAQDSFRE